MVLTYSSYGKKAGKVDSYYYKCNKKYTMYNCSNSNINGKEIEDFVIDKMKVTNRDVLVAEYKKLKDDFKNLKPKDNVNISNTIDAKEKAIELLVMQLTESGGSSASKYIIAQIEKLSSEVEDLKSKLDGVNDTNNDIELELLNIDLILDNLDKFNKDIADASNEQKKLLIGSVVDKITWDGDLGEVKIFYHGIS